MSSFTVVLAGGGEPLSFGPTVFDPGASDASTYTVQPSGVLTITTARANGTTEVAHYSPAAWTSVVESVPRAAAPAF